MYHSVPVILSGALVIVAIMGFIHQTEAAQAVRKPDAPVIRGVLVPKLPVIIT